MGKSFCALFKKDCRMLVSGKFFLMALGFLVLYTAYVNLGYIRFMQMPPYNVYLYDPTGIQTEKSSLVQAVPSMEAMDAALLSDANGVGLDAGAVVGCAVDELFFQAGFLAEVGEGFGITFTDGGVEEEGAFGGEGAVGKGVGGQVVIIVVYVDDEVVVEGFDFFVIGHGGGIEGVCKSGHFFVFFGGYRKEVW